MAEEELGKNAGTGRIAPAAGEDRKRLEDEEIHAEDFFVFGTFFF